MRKHIVLVSEESYFAGKYHCGIGEVADTLAEALRKHYDVTLITCGKQAGGRAGGTITVGKDGDAFTHRAAELCNELNPDLIHNLDGDPDLIDLLTVDCPTVYTFDRWEECADKLASLRKYTHVTTVSEMYAQAVREWYAEAVELNVVGITNGISGDYFQHMPTLFNRASYYAQALKREDAGKKLIVSMGRLAPEKGIQDIIDEAEAIAATGAELVVYGKGEETYRQQLEALDAAGVLTFIPQFANYGETLAAFHAADFLLMPSTTEPCGLTPMKAARMGCVPIVRRVGGLAESFDSTNSVEITGTLASAVRTAVNLSESEYSALRAAGMEKDWTWATRVLAWVELYGLETAPPSESAFLDKATGTEKASRKPPFARVEDEE